MSEVSDPRQYRPHVARNRDPILDVLKRVLPLRGLVLELAGPHGTIGRLASRQRP
jgi:Protein of unknown function (DUF938)